MEKREGGEEGSPPDKSGKAGAVQGQNVRDSLTEIQ